MVNFQIDVSDHIPQYCLFDFCKRIDLRKVNRRVLEALIRSGSMDFFGVSRSTLSYNLSKAILDKDLDPGSSLSVGLNSKRQYFILVDPIPKNLKTENNGIEE